jgi:hypothetical protein
MKRANEGNDKTHYNPYGKPWTANTPNQEDHTPAAAGTPGTPGAPLTPIPQAHNNPSAHPPAMFVPPQITVPWAANPLLLPPAPNPAAHRPHTTLIADALLSTEATRYANDGQSHVTILGTSLKDYSDAGEIPVFLAESDESEDSDSASAAPSPCYSLDTLRELDELHNAKAPSPRWLPAPIPGWLRVMHIDKASAEELNKLARTLPDNRRITTLTLNGDFPESVKATLDALGTNQTVSSLRIECSSEDFAPRLLAKLTKLLEKQTPLKQLELIIQGHDGGLREFTFDQAFFKALFAHSHLTLVTLNPDHSDRFYLHSPQQLAETVTHNTNLRELQLLHCKHLPQLLQAIAPGLAGNRSIRELDLSRSTLVGCGQSMAALLTANQSITKLNIKNSTCPTADLEKIIAALGHNTGIEEFYCNGATQDYRDRPALGAPIGAILQSNQHLRSLSIHCKLDHANVTAIQRGLRANSSLRFLDLGNIDDGENTPGTTDANDAIDQLFASNHTLTTVKLRLPTRDGTDGNAGLKGLERNQSIHSVWVQEAQTTDGLVRLLNNNPRITELKLTSFGGAQPKKKDIAVSLKSLADNIQGNTSLRNFDFTTVNYSLLDDPYIHHQLACLDKLCADNRKLHEDRKQQLQRISAPTVGVRMLTEFRNKEDAQSPVLTDETALAITTAIDTVLPPAEAQRVLDALRFKDILETPGANISTGEKS